MFRGLCAELHTKIQSWQDLIAFIKAKIVNLQTHARAYHVGQQHNDIGNDLYQAMLDKLMIYSCGYWKTATTLDDAQIAKIDLICRKLDLHAVMRVLDIGCGWGSAAKYADENYGVEVIGVTISKEQAKIAQQLCRGFPVEIRLQDYRKVNETFDKIYSIGMFEHVGHKNYPTYMQVASRCLKQNGLFLLHSIGANYSDLHGNPWVEHY